jgi:hypothetical protein
MRHFPARIRDSKGHMMGPMRLLEALASLFINTFGITQPTDATRRRAAWFILCLLILTLVVVSSVGYVLYRSMHA